MAADTFIPLTIKAVERETAEAISVLFDLPNEHEAAFAFKAGQHLTLKVDIDGEEVRRNYSLCAAPHEGKLKVAIKQIAGGRFSTWANQSLEPGQAIEVMPPHGSFTWAFDAARQANYVGFAGGSGITPVLSLLKTALQEEPKSNFTLLYGNRASSDIIFLEEIASIKDRFMGRFQVYHFLEDELEDIELFNGRLDSDKLADLIGTLITPEDVTAAFICGPGPMMDAIEVSLKTAGLGEDQILLERFTTGAPSAAQAAADRELTQKVAGLEMQVRLEGRTRKLVFDGAQDNILDTARAKGLPAPYACKAGVCATCRAKLLSGEVKQRATYGLSKEDTAAGYVLTCQSIPLTEDVVLDFEG
ncbi:MAG: 2Fe-2S iron-sulfur cluster-binding protein [Pseudomonadota bacterium]